MNMTKPLEDRILDVINEVIGFDNHPFAHGPNGQQISLADRFDPVEDSCQPQLREYFRIKILLGVLTRNEVDLIEALWDIRSMILKNGDD